MTDEQAAKLVAAEMVKRKITAVVIGRTFRHLNHPITDLLIRHIGPNHLQSIRQYDAIESTNGSRVVLATPNGLHKKLASLSIDLIWVATSLTSEDWQFVRNRTLVAAAVVLESV